jgi:hypothetical protein
MAIKRARTGVVRGRCQNPGRSLTALNTGSAWRGDSGKPLRVNWTKAVSDDQWAIYAKAIQAVRSANVPFMLGGGFALASFTGRWRDTKDVDFYIQPGHRDRVVEALSNAGFKDYFAERPYDRKWIYRSVQTGVIVDIIWAMANQRTQVDELWFERSGQVELRGERLAIVPPEELMWCKLYILQRDHCDWTDVFNLLYAAGPRLDWQHLIDRLEEDTPLLKALLQVYAWLCPKDVLKLPKSLWKTLALPSPRKISKPKRNHITLLDSRGWFAALQPPDRKLEV